MSTRPLPDPMEDLAADVKLIKVVLVGGIDANGNHHPGLLNRVGILERAYLWVTGIATAAVASLVVAWTGVIGPHK